MAATRKKREATPLEIARHGHIATALRAYLARAKIGVADMNERLGRQRKDAVIYHYLAGKGAPTADNRKAISKLTGIPEAELKARDVDAPPRESLGQLARSCASASLECRRGRPRDLVTCYRSMSATMARRAFGLM